MARINDRSDGGNKGTSAARQSRRAGKREKGSHLVISEESGLLGVLAGFAAAARCRVDLEIGRVREREGAAVGRHADDHLLLRRAEPHPHRGRVIDTQLFLPLRV